MEKLHRFSHFANEGFDDGMGLIGYGDETTKRLVGKILADNKDAWVIGVKTAEAYHNEFANSGKYTRDYLGLECMPEYCHAGDTCYLDPAAKGDESVVCCVVLDLADDFDYAEWIGDKFGVGGRDARDACEGVPLETLVKEVLNENGVDWNRAEYKAHHKTGEPIVLKFRGKGAVEKRLADTVGLVTSYVATMVREHLTHIGAIS